jgi:hypothetical protein
MSKSLKTNQQFAAPPQSAAANSYPRLEEIKRTLFPLLVATEATQSSLPRFADLVDQFSANRSA